MDWKKELFDKNEKPLDRLVEGYSNTSLFRSIAVIGDSLSSGEFEIWEDKGAARYYDMYEYSWGQFLARNCGTKVYNFSRGGMTAEEYLDFFGEKFSLWGRDKACQAYIIALGVNDIYNKDMEIGSIEGMEYIAENFDGFYMKRELNRNFAKIEELQNWCNNNQKQLFMLQLLFQVI